MRQNNYCVQIKGFLNLGHLESQSKLLGHDVHHGSLPPSSLALSCLTLLACFQVICILFFAIISATLPWRLNLDSSDAQPKKSEKTLLSCNDPFLWWGTRVTLHSIFSTHTMTEANYCSCVDGWFLLTQELYSTPFTVSKWGGFAVSGSQTSPLKFQPSSKFPHAQSKYPVGFFPPYDLAPSLYSQESRNASLKNSSDTTKHSRFDLRPLLCWLMMGREQSASPAKWQATCNIIIVVVVSNALQKLEHVAVFHFQALTNKFFEYSAVIQFASPM